MSVLTFILLNGVGALLFVIAVVALGVIFQDAITSILVTLTESGKSPFVQDCVVGLRGLEPPTKRLSAGSSEHSVPAGNRGQRAGGWEDSNFQPNDYQPPALSIEHSGAVS